MLSSRQRIKIPDSDVLLHVPVYKLAHICVKKNRDSRSYQGGYREKEGVGETRERTSHTTGM